MFPQSGRGDGVVEGGQHLHYAQAIKQFGLGAKESCTNQKHFGIIDRRSLQPEACTLCPATPTCFPECAHTHTHGARHVCKACLSVGGVWVVGGVCVGRVAAFPVAVYIVKWLGSKIVREIVLKFVWTMINVA